MMIMKFFWYFVRCLIFDATKACNCPTGTVPDKFTNLCLKLPESCTTVAIPTTTHECKIF